MRPQWIVFIWGSFLIGTLLSCLGSGRWLMSGETDIINALASFNTMSVQAGGVWNAPKTLGTYWDALVTALSWNYPFLNSPWAFPLKFICLCITGGVVWGLIQVFATIIQGLVGFVRAF